VFVVQCVEGVLPSRQSLRHTEDGTGAATSLCATLSYWRVLLNSFLVAEEGVEEERRLMFVAMSRAKRHLFLSYMHGTQLPFTSHHSVCPGYSLSLHHFTPPSTSLHFTPLRPCVPLSLSLSYLSTLPAPRTPISLHLAPRLRACICVGL
jgi:hypothetical protein